jgi:hypothetical protein
MSSIKEIEYSIAHPRELSFYVGIGESSSVGSRQNDLRLVFDADGLKEEAIDQPTQLVDLKDALIGEKNSLVPRQKFASFTANELTCARARRNGGL